jgi:AcrR family transcriptional regulator
MAAQTPRRPLGARSPRGAGKPRPAARPGRLRALEPQRDRRRRQLLEVAAHLVVREGVEAVRMARVADLAGCARPLVYHYFKTREDLLLALVLDAEERFERAGTWPEIDRAIESLASSEPSQLAAAERFFRMPWIEGRDEGILAGLALRVRLHTSRDFAGHVERVRERSGARWRRPLRELGLTEGEASAVEECAVALLGRALRDGESRAAEIATSVRALSHLVRGFLADHGGARRGGQT